MKAVTTDAELAGLDVVAAIGRGIPADGQARQIMFTDAAIAAAIEAEELGVGPYPVAVLARVVRAGGVAEALRLPEPLIGAEPTALARRWLEAAVAAADNTKAALAAADNTKAALAAADKAEAALAAADKAEAAVAAGDKADLVFSRWLEMVATLVAVRQSARPAAGTANGTDRDA
jgi:hypothetical protein